MKRTWTITLKALGLGVLASALVLPALAQNQDQQDPQKKRQDPPAQTQPAPTQQKQQPTQTQPAPTQQPSQTQPTQQQPAQTQPAQTQPAQQPAQTQPAQKTQTQAQATTGGKQGTRVRGQIVRTTNNGVVVRTQDGREVNVFVNPQTRYRGGNRDIAFADLRVGGYIDAAYVVQGDQWIANDLVFAQEASALPVFEAQQPLPQQVVPQGQQLTGRVARIGTDQVVVVTNDNRQVTLFVNPQTQVMVNGQLAQVNNLRVGETITITFVQQGDRMVANSITVVAQQAVPVQQQPAPQPVQPVQQQPVQPVQGTVVEGQVVRVVGQDQVVIRTADGREVVVYVQPQTTYQLTEQGGAFTDLRPGADVRVNYDVRDRRNFARGIMGRRR